jgi:flagellar protein FlaI
MYNLLQAALRQRPEYILVGEIRTEQNVALTFFQAMGTGHTAYTTVHADNVETAVSRLQNPPLSVPTQMLIDLDIISIQRQTFLGDRRVRRNAAVAELKADDVAADSVDWDSIFEWDAESDTHERVGESGVLDEIARERGWSKEQLSAEFETRRRLLQYLVDEGIRGYTDVATAIQAYTRNPGKVLAAVDDGSFDPADFDSRVSGSDGAAAHDAIASAGEGPRGAGTPPGLDAATYESVLAAAAGTAEADLERLGDERPAGGLADAADAADADGADRRDGEER